MVHCKACDGSMELDTVKVGWGDEQKDTGVDEILCGRCIEASRLNMPEDYYEGLYKDRHAHACHYVMSPEIVDLLTGAPGYDWKSTAPDGADTK